MVENR